MATSDLPLEGVRILDFSQFLAGPYASLRLADLGADVVKVERAGKGDLSRYLYVSNVSVEGESTIFHAINRGKRSLEIDLKTDRDRASLQDLVAGADIIIQNFRPGVIERLGFGYEAVKALNPKIIYGSISGYGADTAWKELPGQDLLTQARSGVMWLSGGADDGPVAIGLPVADMLAGAALAQGILALLFRRERTGKGGLIETSLLEAITDLQFELLTTHLNDGGRKPERQRENPAHAYLAAPYGVYRTADGHIALGMNDLAELWTHFGVEGPLAGLDPFVDRDTISAALGAALAKQTTDHWMRIAMAQDFWAAPVLSWDETLASGVLQDLDMLHSVALKNGPLHTTAIPMRIDGTRPKSTLAAPQLGTANALLDTGWS
ncbi:CaiB/BaiF CoA transferase family protein [Hoeflea sp. Naph1]|uniref:CaiB/BaiF CoA transferase family protein n=1 Tax=Hoeflea sp. Naph1 TaxID=3388653 RepID=UPI00398FD920